MGKHQGNSDEEDLEETEFIVEKILDRKLVNGEVFYFLKWKGFNETENTWVGNQIEQKRESQGHVCLFSLKKQQEPEMNLDCPELIADYHKRAKQASERNESIETNKRPLQTNIEQEETTTTTAPVVSSVAESAKKIKRANDYGYERGLEIERILGATDVYGELMFL